ncbi:hypothetical protein D3228_13320 [Leucobacter luti]|nr:hypothetical protein [Leucobacter luti]
MWLGAGAAAAIAAGALTWSLWPVQDLDTHTVLGVEVTTNLEVAAHGGYIYVTVPVNADASEAVLHVPDEGDNLRIREFLDGLDTLVPGEHVLALSEANLHFIVDGIEE